MTRLSIADIINKQIAELRRRKQIASEQNDHAKAMSYDHDIAALRIAKDGLYR